jgi:citrate lyase gamma subunit
MVRVNEGLETGMTGLLGQPAEGPVSAVSDIMRRSAPERTASYDAAYSTPIDYADASGRQIETIITQRIEPDILNQAIQQANAEMRDRGMTNMQIMARIADDGSLQFVEMPNVRQLDEYAAEFAIPASGQ